MTHKTSRLLAQIVQAVGTLMVGLAILTNALTDNQDAWLGFSGLVLVTIGISWRVDLIEKSHDER